MKYALIVGNNQYVDEKLSQLKTPVDDARELGEVISNKKIGGFETVSLINKTEAEVRSGVSEFLDEKKPDDLVLLYFSGHGILDSRGRLYLAFKDTKSNNLSGTALQSSFVTEVMDDCRSKRQILILDCCHSGAFARGGKKTGEQQAVTEATFAGEGYGRAVLTASSSLQFALEGNQVLSHIHLSLFTHYLLEGLRTGDADKDDDGNISLDEWFDYTYSKVVSATSSQKPQKWIYEQEGKLLIAKNPNIKKKLPFELLQILEHSYPDVRLIAVTRLAGFLRSQDQEMSTLALGNLEKLTRDIDDRVAVSAKTILQEYKKPSIPNLTIKSDSQAFAEKVITKLTETKSTEKKNAKPQNRPLHVFLNHSSADKPLVRDLYQKLRAESWIQPWLDEEELIPGQDWNLEIEKAIHSADVILICLSNSSITKAGYIQRELRLALDYAELKPEGALFVVPIRLEDAQIPRSLAKYQYLDYFGPHENEAYRRLLLGLRKRAEQLEIKV